MIRRRGLSLVELILALSLLGVFSLLACRLLIGNLHVATDTVTADGNSLRFYGAIHALRADVFQSTSLEMPGPNLLRIHGPGNRIIDWQNDGDELSRSTASEKKDWIIGQPVNVNLDGSVVLVSANPNDQMAMASIHPGGGR
jgi:prepilin-type N-terminal cleavage/methylation domain-containing protein